MKIKSITVVFCSVLMMSALLIGCGKDYGEEIKQNSQLAQENIELNKQILEMTKKNLDLTQGFMKASEENFSPPTVKLSHVEVQKYWGWWFFSNKTEPAKGKAGNYGAPLALAFIFEIQNPNAFPVLMEEFKFTVGFEDFDLDTVISADPMWIPGRKTNTFRALSVFDARSAQLSLLVTGGFKLKEKGISFWDALEKFWTGIQDFSFPVHANQGSAIFKADGIVKGVSFSATFPS